VTIFKGWFGSQPYNFTGIVEAPRGDKFWLLNGESHRVDGPSSEWADGHKTWYLNGEYMSEEEHYKKTAYLRTTLGKLIFNEHFKLERDSG
jgi:hypothetical protein